MTIEAQRKARGKEFFHHVVEMVANPRRDEFHGGVPFEVAAAPPLILGLRVCSIGINCGWDNSRLFKKLDDAMLPQFVPWKCEVPPTAYVSGRHVFIEAAWPEELQQNDIRLDDVSSPDVRDGGRIIVGPNARGVNITLPAREIEHLLVAGQTGSGKSWTLRSIAAQLRIPPRDRLPNLLVMLDGKGGEGLGIINGLPGQVGPLAIDTHSTIDALGWCVDEMQDRYEKIRASGGWKLNGDTSDIFVIFDEFQRYTKDSSNPVIVELMNRLATQGRAARIHVIAGTQKPLVGVFGDSTTQDQFSAAIGGRVKSYQASQAIFGSNQPRADTLLPHGDAYIVANVPRLVQERVQVAYIPEADLARAGGGQPQLEQWPEYDVSGLSEKKSGRPTKQDTPQELALGIETALRGNGRPWFRAQFENGNTPGAGRARRILTRCREIVAIMTERGIEYAAS